MKFNIEEIVKKSNNNFRDTWVKSTSLIPRNTSVKVSASNVGKSHPVRSIIQKSRRIFLYLGFDEAENRTIFPDSDVFKQYGPEAPVILDRSFYLAKLPREDIGLSNKKIIAIEKVIGPFCINKFQELLRDYKKGSIEGDDFIEELCSRLSISQEKAIELFAGEALSEFKLIKPKITNLTLRTHMTAGWYETLSALQDSKTFPLALFSVGPRYRNEQREDGTHLRVHHSASAVVLDPNMSLEAGKEITKNILLQYGFENTKFEPKKTTSNYYAKDQELEVFVKHNNKWLEIANIGMYSVISLANFGIEYPVFNVGLGIERLAMVLGNHKDIRKLTFPQFNVGGYSDQDITQLLTYHAFPNTEVGKKIALGIENTARNLRDEKSPCKFIAYEDKDILVEIVEKEKDKKLIGPAAFNEVYVKNGNILTQSESENNKRYSYISGIANKIASDIEQDIDNNEVESCHQVKIVKSLNGINLSLPADVKNYLLGEHKNIIVKGPIFITVQYKRK